MDDRNDRHAAVEKALALAKSVILQDVPSCAYRETALSYLRDAGALCATAIESRLGKGG